MELELELAVEGVSGLLTTPISERMEDWALRSCQAVSKMPVRAGWQGQSLAVPWSFG